MKAKFFLGFSLVSFFAAGAEVVVGNIKYELSDELKTATVTGYDTSEPTGSLDLSVVSVGDKTYAITKIGEAAFSWCKNLTSVKMENVREIGYYAFGSCYGLQTVSMPKVEKIGGSAFFGTSLSSLFLPAVKTIGGSAFSATALTDVNLPLVQEVGSECFYDCYELTSVKMPCVKYVQDKVFYYCHKIQAVDISKATGIGGFAFFDCDAVTEVVAPCAETVGTSAFAACENLASVALTSVKKIGRSAFDRCPKLKTIRLGGCFPLIEEDSFLGLGDGNGGTVIMYPMWYFGEWAYEPESDWGGAVKLLYERYDPSAYLRSPDAVLKIRVLGCDLPLDWYNAACADAGVEPMKPVSLAGVVPASVEAVEVKDGLMTFTIAAKMAADLTNPEWQPKSFQSVSLEDGKLKATLPVKGGAGFVRIFSGEVK